MSTKSQNQSRMRQIVKEVAAGGEPPILRTSERRDFKRCEQRWVWAWRQGLKSRSVKANALWFGTGIHLALQERYRHLGTRRGRNVLKVWRDYVNDEIAWIATSPKGIYPDPEPEWVEAGELGEAMLGAYLDYYGRDPEWDVLATEQSFQIPIPAVDLDVAAKMRAKGRKPRSLITYAGTFDLVAMDTRTDSLWLWDHKTAAQIMTKHLALDDQAGSYFAFASDVLLAQGLIKKPLALNGIMYNFLRKAKPDPRPKNAEGLSLNKDGTVSKAQPAAIFVREKVERTPNERRRQVEKIQDEAMHMAAVRSGLLRPTKNVTRDCGFDCVFFELCQLHENSDDWKMFKSGSFRREDPYADHRKSTAE